MDRVVVIGTSGSGKTTLAAELAARLTAAHLELDSVHHLSDWEQIELQQFRREVSTFIDANPRWIIDGNYSKVRDLTWPAADTIIWLDLSRRRTMWRIVWRSVRRLVTREELWNGNRERLSNLMSWEPERSIIRWAWTTHARWRNEYPQLLADPRWGEVVVHRLTTPSEVADLLASASG